MPVPNNVRWFPDRWPAMPGEQIYAYDHVPKRPIALLGAGWAPDAAARRAAVPRRAMTGQAST